MTNNQKNLEIPQNRMDRFFYKYQEEFEQKALEVLRSGWYVLGKEVQSFEQEYASYVGAKHCIGLASGLDALWIAFRVLGIGVGDEVIVQANTYIASVMGITMNGATPVFVEPDDSLELDPNRIEEKITDKTKAVLVVHLYGQASDMTAICDICQRHHLRLVEDCAQSHGARHNGKMTGIFGDVGCFSFYPSKNLGAFGDAGAVVTNDDELARKFRVFRNYGSEKRYYNEVVGTNSRLDEIQAGLLRVRLSHVDEILTERNSIADYYKTHLDLDKYHIPATVDNSTHVWHQFVVLTENRDELMQYLKENHIGTIVHYPIPPHLSQAYEYLHWKKGDFPKTEWAADHVLSLPMFNGITEEELEKVVTVMNEYRK